MKTSAAYISLLDHVRRISLLESSARLLTWDQESFMPTGGPAGAAVAYRGRQLSQLAGLIHSMQTDRRVGDWLGVCEADPNLTADPHGDGAVNLREIRREYDRAVKVPAQLVQSLSHAAAVGKHAWAQARKANRFELFRPHLQEIVRLLREQARCWGFAPGGEPWDALGDAHEPGITARQVEELFGPLRKELISILDQVRGGQRVPDRLRELAAPVDRQRSLGRAVAAQLGFDFDRGRLDESLHPFCLPLHRDDVRMTARFRENLPLDGLGSTMHETGHGLYNQNLPGGEAIDTPLGQPLRYAIHESQARMIENQVGRSRAFWGWCGPLMREHGSHGLNSLGDHDLYAAANIVEPSLIRTEADELTYNLHILVRFELERNLISGELAVADLPGAWAHKYREYLDIEVPDDARGCLQDIHWAQGAVGYFPSYTLGNLYAAQFFEAAEGQIGDLHNLLVRGEFGPLVGWLRQNIHRHGRRYTAQELCVRVTGRALSPGPFLEYLRGKLLPLHTR